MQLTTITRRALVSAIMDDVPSVDYDQQINDLLMKASIAKMPPAVKKVYKSNRDWIIEKRHHFDAVGSVYLPLPEGEGLPEAVHKELQRLGALRAEQNADRRDLQEKLRTVIEGARTDAQFRKMLPEFENYLPKNEDGADRQLPIIANLITDFVKAGWRAQVSA